MIETVLIITVIDTDHIPPEMIDTEHIPPEMMDTDHLLGGGKI